uniref:Uncharacterized protein n=1 Tax=Romanomermis culicivorax TaxID=13658 RepID=A0A915HQK7_ROMCU
MPHRAIPSKPVDLMLVIQVTGPNLDFRTGRCCSRNGQRRVVKSVVSSFSRLLDTPQIYFRLLGKPSFMSETTAQISIAGRPKNKFRDSISLLLQFGKLI